MASGAVSEIVARSQNGAAPVAILQGAHTSQGKFGSLQDFWSILGTHGIIAPTAAATVGDGSSTKFPEKPIAHPSLPVAGSKVGGSNASLVKTVMDASLQTPAVGPVSKQATAGDVKKQVKTSDADAVVAKSSVAPDAGVNSVAIVAPVPVEAAGGAKASHDTGHRAAGGSRIPDGLVSKQATAGDVKKQVKTSEADIIVAKSSVAPDAGVNSVAIVAPVPVEAAGGAKASHDTGHRAAGGSRIPDGLVNKQDAGVGVASTSDKAQAIGAETANSGTGHSGGNATAMGAAVIGLAIPQAVDPPTTFAATLVPVMDHAVSIHGATPHTGGLPESALGSTANGDGESVAGYGGSSGYSEPRTMVANSNVLEVGLTGGAHGWLRVRAELGHTGEVTASLVASNAGSAQSLDKQLGAMADYLKSEAVSVGSLTVSASEKSAGTDVSGGSSGGAGADSGSSSGGGGNAKNGQNAPDWASVTTGSSPEEVLNGIAQSMVSGGGSVPSALLGSGVGGWLNVRV